MTNATQVRDAFWHTFYVEGKPRGWRWQRQNDLPCDVRIAFIEYVDHLARNGDISPRMAESITL
jgi:hypothetical protein